VIPCTILAALAALAGGWVYAWLAVRTPAFLDFFLLLLFALGLGRLASLAAWVAKVRNPLWMGRFGLLVGLAGWYGHWAAYIAVLAHQYSADPSAAFDSYMALLGNPPALAGAMSDLYAMSGWKLIGIPLSGFAVDAAWALELAVMLILPLASGRARAGQPFCEVTNRWARQTGLPRRLACLDAHPDALAHMLEAQPRRLLSLLAPWPDGQPRYLKLTLYRCPGSDSYLSITTVEIAEKDGKAHETRRLILEYLRLPGMDPDELIQLGAPPSEQSTAAAGDPPDTRAELLPAIDHLQEGRYEPALAAAAPYLKAEHRQLRVDAVRLSALATAHLGRWNESLGFWNTLFGEQATAHNALQLANACVMTGQLTEGAAWLERARQINAGSQDLPGLFLLTSFIAALTRAGHMHAALPYLNEIREFYLNLPMTDPTYLFAHRVPALSVFLENSAPVIHAALGPDEGHAWYSAMHARLDDLGRAELTAWLDSRFREPGARSKTA
jgi:hypothetical protein